MFKKIISFFTGAPVEQIGEYFREKQRLKHELKLESIRGKARVQEAKVEAEIARQNHLQDWEMASIQNSGFKDEVVLGLVVIVLAGCFIPVTQEAVLRGFEILAMTPLWFQCITVTIFLAVYGIRWKHASEFRIRKREEQSNDSQ